MKKIILYFIYFASAIGLHAQGDSLKLKPTIGFHGFYNDFETPFQIKSNSLTHVIQNNLWNKPYKMQGGFGVDYMQGLTQKIDLIGTINTSWVNYLQRPSYTLFGSSHLMLDINAGANIKAFNNRRIVNPYLITKAGFSSFKNLKGFTLVPGAGIQFTVFKEIFIHSTLEYRLPMSKSLTPQLYYSIGIATNIIKNKPPKSRPVTVVSTEPVKVQEPEKIITKNISIIVNDEATSQPLEYAEVMLKDKDGNIFTAITNGDGKADFKNIVMANYQISARLNKIDASSAEINASEFKSKGNQLQLELSHNDPRFTLVGNTIDKSNNNPVGNTNVTVTNKTLSSTSFVNSRNSDGEFRSQLESNSDFVVVGKKASYISNIEELSTKGLNRSATLYVKLQLGIEEAKAGKTIVLNKIFFETGKADLKASTSQDLQKLILFMLDNPEIKLEIQGHTDNVGSVESNMRLSQARANSVVNYLTANQIPKERLVAKGYGPNAPIANNVTTEGKAQNRRVEMKVF